MKILAFPCVLFMISGCDQAPQPPIENSSADVSTAAPTPPTVPACTCPASTTLADGTDLASLFSMRDGVLHLTVPVSIEVNDTATALSLSGGRFGLDVKAYETGIHSVVNGQGNSVSVYAENMSAANGARGVVAISSGNGSGQAAVYAESQSSASGGRAYWGKVSAASDGTCFLGEAEKTNSAFTSLHRDGNDQQNETTVDCPEVGDCGCSDGYVIEKIVNRGSQIVCRKN